MGRDEDAFAPVVASCGGAVVIVERVQGVSRRSRAQMARVPLAYVNVMDPVIFGAAGVPKAEESELPSLGGYRVTL